MRFFVFTICFAIFSTTLFAIETGGAASGAAIPAGAFMVSEENKCACHALSGNFPGTRLWLYKQGHKQQTLLRSFRSVRMEDEDLRLTLDKCKKVLGTLEILGICQ